MSAERDLLATPSVLALRPGAKLSRVDRAALATVGITVVRIDPEDLVPIQNAAVLPGNDMLRFALEVIQGVKDDQTVYGKTLRADLAKRLIAAYLALGETVTEKGGAA